MNHSSIAIALFAALTATSAIAGETADPILASFERIMEPESTVVASTPEQIQADPLVEAISAALYGEPASASRIDAVANTTALPERRQAGS